MRIAFGELQHCNNCNKCNSNRYQFLGFRWRAKLFEGQSKAVRRTEQGCTKDRARLYERQSKAMRQGN